MIILVRYIIFLTFFGMFFTYKGTTNIYIEIFTITASRPCNFMLTPLRNISNFSVFFKGFTTRKERRYKQLLIVVIQKTWTILILTSKHFLHSITHMYINANNYYYTYKTRQRMSCHRDTNSRSYNFVWYKTHKLRMLHKIHNCWYL